MQGSITTPGSLALAQAQSQPPKAPQPGQPSTLVTTAATTTTKTTTITRPTPGSFKKDVPVSTAPAKMVRIINYFTFNTITCIYT